MRYIIMCGGYVCDWDTPKHLWIYKGKPIVQRTIDLLKEAGIAEDDIAITTSPKCVDRYEGLGAEVIPYESNNDPFVWVDAFYPTTEPTCYLFGDVIFSPEAIQEIVNTRVLDIEFFASAPPFASDYKKPYAEPFAFKVMNQTKFQCAILATKCLNGARLFNRHPIAWELWQVIRDTELNKIDYTNYHVINDYTCDVDTEKELEEWQNT